MKAELLGLDLANQVPEVWMPVLFFLGRYDRHADATQAPPISRHCAHRSSS
jgi:hypothetical protein